MKEDMSDMMQKIGSMLNNSNISDNLKSAMDQLKNSSSSDGDKSSDTSSSNSQSQINPEMLQNILNIFSSQSKKQEDSNSSRENPNSSDSGIDFETIMKMKTIFEKMNQTKKDDPRANLLLSLKPYLKNSRKEKVDQYIKLLNMGKIIEVLKPDGGDQTDDV